MKFAYKNKWFVFITFIWIIIFCTPPLRNHLRAWYSGSPWLKFTIIPNDYWDTRFNEHPQELPLQVTSIKSKAWTEKFKTLDNLDHLIQKNPNLPWLIALRLRVTMSVFNRTRVGGELADGLLEEHRKKGIPSPETNGEKINFTPEQMYQTLALCKLGEKLEPQNAFFRWMRTYFLLINWQDEKAWQALDDAAHKTYWNNHYVDFQNLYARSSRKILNRPLLPLEKITIPAQSITLSYNATMREMGRVIAWEGIKAKREGNHAKALRILGSAYHTMTLACLGESDFIGFSRYKTIFLIVASGAGYPNHHRKNFSKRASRQQRLEKLRESRQILIDTFIAYANKHHRPDLAKLIHNDWQKVRTVSYRAQTTGYKNIQNDFHQVSLAYFSYLLSVVGVTLILTLLGATFMWIILTCINQFFHRNINIAPTAKVLSWQEKLTGIISCSGVIPFLSAATILILWSFITSTDISSGWSIAGLFSNPDHTIIEQILDYATGLPPFATDVPWRLFILFTPLIAGASYVIYKKSQYASRDESRSFRKKLLQKIHLFLLFFAWGLLVLTTDDEPAQIIVAAIAAIFLLVSLIWMWRKSAKTSAFYAMQLFRSSLAGWICTASILVLMVLISQTVLDNHLQPWADSQLRGEMHLLHNVQDSVP